MIRPSAYMTPSARSICVTSARDAMTIRRSHCQNLCWILLVMMATLLLPEMSPAQEPGTRTEAGTQATGAQEDIALAARQAGIVSRYQKLEALLLRLADMEAAENPERSALLRRAARQSRETFVLDKLRDASSALETQQFQAAVDNQAVATEGIESLLKLLLSEDRSKRIREEKERIGKIINELKRAERAQRSTRARTENGADLDDVRQEQESISERAEALSKELSGEETPAEAGAESGEEPEKSPADEQAGPQAEMKDAEGGGEKKPGAAESESETLTDDQPPSENADVEEITESDENPGESKKPGESQSSKEPSERPSEPPDGQPKDSQGQPKAGGQPKQGERSQADQSEAPSASEQNPSESQQSPSQNSQGQPQQSSGSQSPPQSAPKSPQQQAQQQLQEATEKMRQAEQELEDAQREQATEKQRQAEEKLRAAIDRLEKILRQLREEEMQRELAKLESRLRKMAAMQSQVLDDCVALAATPETQRNRQTALKAGNLAFEEKKITLEADRAMLLLREEGSSVAFPEVVEQIRTDTVRVAQRLAETKIDAVTQGIQQDILAALEEMVAALQQAQRDLEKQKQQQQQQGQPQQGAGEQPLVEALAELKLIRTMEQRVKTTTDRYGDLLESGETTGEEILPLLEDLSDRQNRLYQITRDLVLKRNQ